MAELNPNMGQAPNPGMNAGQQAAQPQFAGQTLPSDFQWYKDSIFKPRTGQPTGSVCKYDVLLVLSCAFGWLGFDRFYQGKVLTGVLKLITWGGLGVWYLIDLYLNLTKQPTDVYGRNVEGFTTRKTFFFTILTLFGGPLGLGYLYLGFKRLFAVRALICLGSLLMLVVAFLINITFGVIFFCLLYIIHAAWVVLDLYLGISGKVNSDATGNPLHPVGPRYQSVCLVFSLSCLDRFYLGHKVLGLIKLLTFGGFGFWFVFDIFMAILGAHRDVDGQPLVRE